MSNAQGVVITDGEKQNDQMVIQIQKMEERLEEKLKHQYKMLEDRLKHKSKNADDMGLMMGNLEEKNKKIEQKQKEQIKQLAVEYWRREHETLMKIVIFGVLLQASLQIVFAFVDASNSIPTINGSHIVSDWISGSLAVMDLFCVATLFSAKYPGQVCCQGFCNFFSKKLGKQDAINIFTGIIFISISVLTFVFLILDSVTVATSSSVSILDVVDLAFSVSLMISIIYFFTSFISLVRKFNILEKTLDTRGITLQPKDNAPPSEHNSQISSEANQETTMKMVHKIMNN